MDLVVVAEQRPPVVAVGVAARRVGEHVGIVGHPAGRGLDQHPDPLVRVTDVTRHVEDHRLVGRVDRDARALVAAAVREHRRVPRDRRPRARPTPPAASRITYRISLSPSSHATCSRFWRSNVIAGWNDETSPSAPLLDPGVAGLPERRGTPAAPAVTTNGVPSRASAIAFSAAARAPYDGLPRSSPKRRHLDGRAPGVGERRERLVHRRLHVGPEVHDVDDPGAVEPRVATGHGPGRVDPGRVLGIRGRELRGDAGGRRPVHRQHRRRREPVAERAVVVGRRDVDPAVERPHHLADRALDRARPDRARAPSDHLRARAAPPTRSWSRAPPAPDRRRPWRRR